MRGKWCFDKLVLIYSQTKTIIGDGILSTCTGTGVSLNGLAGATDLVGDLMAATGGSGAWSAWPLSLEA